MPMRFSVTETGVEALERNLIALSYRAFDLMPLARRVEAVLGFNNVEGALQGTDRNGELYTRLSRNTWKRGRRGSGPPLSPVGSGSSIVNRFETDISQGGFDELVIRGHWPSLPWVRYHVTGTKSPHNMPIRDPVGIRPGARRMLDAELGLWVQDVLGGGGGPGSIPLGPAPLPSGGVPGGGMPSLAAATGGGGPSLGAATATPKPAAAPQSKMAEATSVPAKAPKPSRPLMQPRTPLVIPPPDDVSGADDDIVIDVPGRPGVPKPSRAPLAVPVDDDDFMIEVGPAAEPPRRTERASAAEEQTSVYGGTQGIPEWQARKMTAAPKVGLSERRKDVVKAQIEPGTAAFKIDRAFQAVGNRQGRHISLKLYDVRKESGLDRETFDRALNQMRSEGVFSLDSNEGLHNKLTKEEYQAGIPYMGASEHEIFLPFISRRDD